MKKLLLAVLVGLSAVTPAVAQSDRPVRFNTGEAVYDAEGKRLADVYGVTSSGSAQILLNGRVITIPVSTLSKVNNKLTTTLSRDDVLKRR